MAAGGGWSITTASPLAIGAHSLSASQVDVAANQSPATAAQSLTFLAATPNRVTFVGTAGTDAFTGGAGSDIFKFTAATLAATDTVKGGAGNDYLDMTTAGTVAAGGVSGVEVYELANGGGEQPDPDERQFRRGERRLDHGLWRHAGNTVNTSGLSAANRAVMVGGAGKDVFTGGAGNDIFEFTTASLAASDTVAGGAGSDQLVMTTAGTVLAGGVSGVGRRAGHRHDRRLYPCQRPDRPLQRRVRPRPRRRSTTPQALPASLFSPQSNGSFTTATQRFAYNSTSGALSYDADGSGAGASRLIATLTTHPTLAITDLFFVA